MKTIFFIDTQKDFMLPEGKLYVPEAEKLFINLLAIQSFFHQTESKSVFTFDTHIPNDEEFKVFPEHCVIDTYGWNNVLECNENDIILRKQTYDMWNDKKGCLNELRVS